MKRVLTAVLFFFALWLPGASAQGRDPALGDWRGVLPTPQGDLTLVVHITAAKGGLTGVMQSPDQSGDEPIPLTVSEPAAGQLTFTAPSLDGSFSGQWSETAGGWSGAWSQSGYHLPLVLRRVPTGAKP
jgi:hypothetical protein